MQNNKKSNKKTSVGATLAALIVAAIGYFCFGGTGAEQNLSNTTPTSVVYESEVGQDTQTTATYISDTVEESVDAEVIYYFRSEDLLESHYQKHGIEMGFESAKEYEAAVSKVVANPDVLYKREAEDNDHVYYLEETNEFVVISTDGYIRTYFLPSRGIDYFNKQ